MIRWAIEGFEARGLCVAASQLHIGFIIFSTTARLLCKRVSTHDGVRSSFAQSCVCAVCVCVLCCVRVCTESRLQRSQTDRRQTQTTPQTDSDRVQSLQTDRQNSNDS
jgi:hypothetical protein